MTPIKVLHILDLDKENYYLNNLCDYTDEQEIEYLFATFAPYDDFVEALQKRAKTVYVLNSKERKKISADVSTTVENNENRKS